MDSRSLDELLKEIQSSSADNGGSPVSTSQSAGMKDISWHEQPKASGNSSPLLGLDVSGTGVPQLTHDMVGSGNVVTDRMANGTGLTERQRRLPKLSYRMLGSLAAVMVLTIGLGSAVFLAQTPQDVRQQAYQGGQIQQPADESAIETGDGRDQTRTESRTQMETGEEMIQSAQTEVEAPLWRQPVVIGLIAVVVAALILLAVFLHWLFAA